MMIELALQGNPKVGTTVRIQATFNNTGQMDTKAEFIGEAYCDKECIDTLESEEMLIPVGQGETLTSYLKVEKPDNIKGYINYEGKKTGIKEISFTVAGSSDGNPFNLFIPSMAVIVILAGVIAYMAVGGRGRPA